MNHPNVVQVFDLGTADGRPYIAMALVEGVPFSRLLKRMREQKLALPLPVVRFLALALCEGLAYVHELKDERDQPLRLIHRDINPSNLLVSTSGAALIADFGIAKALSRHVATRTGRILGKTAYMAPEQTRHSPMLDQRVDLYAAALTLYEAATGVNPFDREGDVPTLDAVREAPLPDPRDLRPELSEGEASALIRGLSRDPASRYPTAQALLNAFLDGPVALPNEVGMLVRQHCAKELERFELASEDGEANETKSLVRAASASSRRFGPLFKGSVVIGLCVLGALAARGVPMGGADH
jgi:serine/threonine-protein kinase